MTPADSTCWTLVRDAAAGDGEARERFALVYGPAVRAYFGHRWRDPQRGDIDDAAQDVFVELLKPAGALAGADATRPGGFRAYLFAVARHVALRHEARRPPPDGLPPEVAADDTSLAAAFDRAWARSLLQEAKRRHVEAAAACPRATRRVELLRLRFEQGLPVRDIAAAWGEEAARLHREYATAREEFRAALRAVVAFHRPGENVDAACAELLGLLG